MSIQSGNNSQRLRRFAVTVDGVRHEVIVEQLDDGPAGASTAGSAGTGAPRAASPPAAPSTTTATGADDNGLATDGAVPAPMPGTVTEVSVSVGDTVNAGDVLLILTAMKLENEITAPTRGVVEAIHVNVGDNVNSDDRLVQLDVKGATS